MFGLSIDNLRFIRQCLAKIPQIDKVLIYGSRAKGNYKTGSDIDLTLIGKNLDLHNSVFPLREMLEESNLPYLFDISIFKDLKDPSFIEHILRVGKTFYLRDKESRWEVKKFEQCLQKSFQYKKSSKKNFFRNG